MLAPNTLGRVLDFFMATDAFSSEMERAYREFFAIAPSVVAPDLLGGYSSKGIGGKDILLDTDPKEGIRELIEGGKRLLEVLEEEDHSDCAENMCRHATQEEKEELRYSSDERTLFLDWLLFSFRLSHGKNLIKYFRDKNPYDLPEDALAVYDQLDKSRYGLYKVRSVIRGSSITVSVFSDDSIVTVQESLGSFDVNIGALLVCRIAPVLDHHEIVGNILFLSESSPNAGRILPARNVALNAKLFREFMFATSLMPDIPKHWSEFGDIRLTRETARAAFKLFLRQYALDGFVNSRQIEGWIQKWGDEKPALLINIIAGLIDSGSVELKDSERQSFFKAAGAMMNMTPRKKDGKSPYDRAQALSTSSNTPHFELQAPYDPAILSDSYHQAIELMKQGKYEEADRFFELTFSELIRQQTTRQDIYRLFANKGVVARAAGDIGMARNMLCAALILNPRYHFAWAELERLEEDLYKVSFPRSRKLYKPLPRIKENIPAFWLSKKFKSELAYKYFCFLRDLHISFEHEPLGSNITARITNRDGTTGRKVERNDPCPCGKKNNNVPVKFKRCCGR